MKLLPDRLRGSIPLRGLLRWRDLMRLTGALRHDSALIVAGAAREIPGGVEIDLEAAAGSSAFVPAPLQPVITYNERGAERVRITPGLVFGGIGWLAPTVQNTSIFSTTAPTIQPADEIYLRITAAPLLPAYEYGGANLWRGPLGTQLISAECIARNLGDPAPEDVTARGLVTTSSPHQSIVLTRNAVLYRRLGTRNDLGGYDPDVIGQRVYSFSTSVTVAGAYREFSLVSYLMPWLPAA